MKKSLAKKFSFCFHVPLVICTVISICVTIPLIIFFFPLIRKNPVILGVFEENIERKSRPILLHVMSILCAYFQKYINNLTKAREFYVNSTEHLNLNNDNFTEMRLQIQEAMFNGYSSDDITKFKEEYNKSQTTTPDINLYRAKWYTKPPPNDENLLKKDLNDLSDREKTIIKQLYVVANSIPLLKTAYELSKPSDEFSIMFSSTELFIEYPFNLKSVNENYLFNYSHSNTCSDNNGTFPNFYYFKCRPYYHSLMKSIEKGLNISFSDIYKYSYGYSGVTSCINFKDTIKHKNDTYVDGNVTICQDFLINELKDNFEKLNNLLTGYFFIAKVDSYIPLYYPNSDSEDEKTLLTMLEFGINSEYYSDDVSKYTSYVDEIISPINLTDLKSMDDYMKTFILPKNGKNYKYTIVPVTLFFDNGLNQQPYHMLSVVFARPNGLDLELFTSVQSISIALAVFYIYVSAIIALISKYLITSIARNIVKTIKVIKKMLEMDYEISTNERSQVKDNYENSNALVKGDEKPLLLRRSNSQTIYKKNYNTSDLDDDDNDSDEDYDDEEEDQSKYRSNNLQELFVKLVDMKNTFKKLNYPSKTSEKLPFLVHAQSIFINNHSIYSTCQSNISSIFIKYHQYDKSISHLLNAIEKIKSENTTLESIKKQFRSENLSNRYLKLFYSYRSYFKEVKRLIQINNIPSSYFYVSHHILKYRQCVDDFVHFTRMVNDPKDLSLALMEKLEEMISFEMGKRQENAPKASKIETIKTILDLFNEVDKLNENLIVSNYNVIHLINILKYDCEMVSSMDIPPSILTQHTLYLKGKFYLKCGHYKLAIENLENSLNFGNIGNITIKINAIKKLIKISKIFKNIVKNELDFAITHESKSKSENENNRQRKLQLENFIYSLNEELIKYKYFERDICFILNLSNISLNSDQFSNAIKSLTYIFENIITYRDRIAIIVYINGMFKIIVNLTQKTYENENSLLSYINSFGSILKFPQNNSHTQEENTNIISQAILYSYQYLLKKQMGLINDKRDNWYIYLTKEVTKEEIDSFKKRPLESYFRNGQLHNLVILLFENEEIKRSLRKYIKFNRSCAINKNDIEKLRDIMGTIGEMQNIEFDLEKYKDIN